MKTAKEVLNQPKANKLQVGIQELDKALGGFTHRDLIVIGSQSSFLLPALTRRLALHVATTENKPVAIIRPGNNAKSTCEKFPELALDAPLYFWDKRGMTIDDINQQLHNLPAPPCLIIIDQAELLDIWTFEPISESIPEPLNVEMAEARASRSLKRLAHWWDCPVIINIDLAYWGSNGTFINRPILSNFGGIAVAADTVLLLETGTAATDWLNDKHVSLDILFNVEGKHGYADLRYEDGCWI